MAKLWWEKVEERFGDFEPKMTWRRLANATDMQPNRFTLWKNGQGLPDIDQIRRIAEAIQVPVEYLIRDDDAPPPGSAVRTPEERLLLDASRKVGVPRILEVIFTAAVRGMDPAPPPAPPEAPVEVARSVRLHPPSTSKAKEPGEGSSPRPGPPKK